MFSEALHPAHLLVLNIDFSHSSIFYFFLLYQTSNFPTRFSHFVVFLCCPPVSSLAWLARSRQPDMDPPQETGGLFPGEACPGERVWEIDSWRLPQYTRSSLPSYPAWSLLISNSIISLSLSHTHTQIFQSIFSCFSLQFSSIQSLSHVQLFATPWTTAHQS